MEQAHAQFEVQAEDLADSAARDVRTLVLELTEPRKAGLFG
jgi:hypothetical protein